MKKQEITCPNCGQVIEVNLANSSEILAIHNYGKYGISLPPIQFEPKYSTFITTQVINIPSSQHKIPFTNTMCKKKFSIQIVIGNPSNIQNNLSSDWSVEI